MPGQEYFQPLMKKRHHVSALQHARYPQPGLGPGCCTGIPSFEPPQWQRHVVPQAGAGWRCDSPDLHRVFPSFSEPLAGPASEPMSWEFPDCSTRVQFPPLWQKGHIWDLGQLNCGQQHLRRFSTSLGFEESQKHSRGAGWLCGVQRSHVSSAQRAVCSPGKLLWP